MTDALPWIAVYIIGFAATVRMQILAFAKEYHPREWDGGDTGAALFFGAVWPIIGWMIAWDLYRAFHPKKPTRKGIFARQVERDRARLNKEPTP